jgi:hypothetical protein
MGWLEKVKQNHEERGNAKNLKMLLFEMTGNWKYCCLLHVKRLVCFRRRTCAAAGARRNSANATLAPLTASALKKRRAGQTEIGDGGKSGGLSSLIFDPNYFCSIFRMSDFGASVHNT